MQQKFVMGPSTVRLTLRGYLRDNPTSQVPATRFFDKIEQPASADNCGGVVAADRVVQRVTEQMSAFCAGAAGTTQDR